jgi:anti-anti-sigma regulatory factor
MTPPRIHVRVQDATATVCIRGRATSLLGPGLREFILQSEAGGVRHFEIGLDDCEYMDSTVLGILAMGQRTSRWSVELLNTPARVLDQLTELGLRPFFPRSVRTLPPAETTMTVLQPSPATDLAGTMREAHATLGQIDPSNQARFAGVLEALDGKKALDMQSNKSKHNRQIEE